MVPLKRRKVPSSQAGSTGTDPVPTRFPQVVLYLLERKMGASRRAFLSQLGLKKGFQVEESFSENVTHVISENNCGAEVSAWLQAQGRGRTPAHLLDVSWYTESMRAGRPVEILDRHKLQHYDDLNQPVTRAEADAIGEVVEKAVVSVLPGARITLTGGFRRGKLTGHDVDFLITHPEEGREAGLIPKVVTWLESQGFLLYQKTTRNSYLESEDGPARPASNMDRFERCFSIFKLAKVEKRGAAQPETTAEDGVEFLTTVLHSGEHTQHTHRVSAAGGAPEAEPTRPWRAVRVDLVVSPISQFAFALLGWTGSKLFERELRRWAGQQKDMSLSSHALQDNQQRTYLRATSEEEIFAHLGLEFIPPSERNA